MRSVVMPEYHVAQDLGAVVVVLVAVLHEGEPVHVAHVRLPISPTTRMTNSFYIFFGGIFSIFSSYYIQHCFICRPSDSTVPTDAGIEPRTVATGALAVRRSNH
jgi:hypothetical protein